MQTLDIALKLLAYEGKATNDPQDSIKIINTFEEEIETIIRQKTTIADGAVDQAIELTSANSEYLLILTDEPVSIKVNGGIETIDLIPTLSGVKTMAYYNKGQITGLVVTNSSGNTANLDIISVSK